MAYGDTHYEFIAAGRTTTSAASAHNLYGNYAGLSLLNQADVLNILVSSSGGDLRISLDPATAASENTPLRLFSAASLFDLPPMKVANASQITISREQGTNNPVTFWTILRRAPL